MTEATVYLRMTLPRDSITLDRTVTSDARHTDREGLASDGLALLVELADEAFAHHGFDPMFSQIVAVDALLDGDEVHPAAEGALVAKVRELLARVAWAEDPENWGVVNGKPMLDIRPDDWTPEAAEPEPAPQWYDHLPFVTGDVRQILTGDVDLTDTATLTRLGEHPFRVAGQLARQELRTTFEVQSPEPGPLVRAVRRLDQLSADEALDVLFVRNAQTSEWEAQGVDGDTYRYRWSDIIAFAEAVDCSDEHRYGVRQPEPGRVVVVDLDKAREGSDDSTFEVEDIGEAWRVVNELHAAAAPPKILARRAAKTEPFDKPAENKEDNR